MDIDISDILASVSRPLQNQTLSTSQQPDLDSTTSSSDHQLLVRAWTSERCSPALLPYPTTLIDRTMQRISNQITRIEDLTSGVPDPYATTTTTTSNTGSGNSTNTNLILSILQTDLSREQFIIRSYLRQRLAKITRHAVYYLKRQAAESESDLDTKNPLLSPAETAFLQNHQALLSRFYDDSFLGAFPENLRRLDDRAGGVDMVEGPDGAAAVVVRCLADAWGNEGEVEGGLGEGEDQGVDEAQTELRMRRGEVWVVRWRDVRTGVVGGDLELL